MTISRWTAFFVLIWLMPLGPVRPADKVVLETIVSHEDAKFDVAHSHMTVGRDGRLYFASGEYLLRMERDGSQRAGSRMTPAMTRGTANAEGIIGTGHAHFAHALKTWRSDFTEISAVADFLNNDQVQYFSPCDVQVGAGGDFFGYDSNRNRILRVSPAGKLVTAYPLDEAGLNTVGKLARFRLWEAGKRFYIRFENAVTCVGFDGRVLWKQELGAAGNPWDGWRDVFDVDDEGRLLVLTRDSDQVNVFDKEGQPAGDIRLELRKRTGRYEDLAVWKDELFVKRADSAELCAVYDRATGALKRSLAANVEVLQATLPSFAWTVGERIPVEISRVSSAKIPDSNRETEHQKSEIKNRIWLRPFNTPDFRELPLNDGHIAVPADASGLYHLRITPDVRGAGSDYQLDAAVEIRVPNAKGSVSIFTPLNRLYFGLGDVIPASVVTRTPYPDELPRQWRVQLFRVADASPDWIRPANRNGVFERFVLTTVDRADRFEIPAHVTRTLMPGRYLLTTDAPGFTVAPQPLTIGEGIETPPKFNLVQHGDYSASFPLGLSGKLTPFDVPDLVADHLLATRKLNLNLFADRIGLGGAGVKQHVVENIPTDELAARLAADPLSVSPEKARIENTLRQTVAARGAFGQEQRGIFLMMDAGLPLGTGFDGRSTEQRDKDLQEVNEALQSYSAFRGWSWAANWWLGKTGENAAKDAAQKAAYQEALKLAKKTGQWSPVLDEVSDEVFSYAVKAERDLRNNQDRHSPGRLLLSAMTGPYRAVFMHPPVIFQNADEVDLHYQMEQIQPPNWTAHAVDFLKRPNKRAWGHPEIWNDDGTGGMLFPTLLPMAARGAEGVGWSGRPHDWTPVENDSRAAGPGLLSMLRSLNELLTIYGPWQITLENRDRVAIVVSTRMQRIGDWHGHLGSQYHEQLFEAYNACLYSHRPAKFVFVEDLKPDSFKDVQAVLIVGQTVELDPPLALALTEANKAGVQLYFDGTCREELVKAAVNEAQPLGVSFDKLNAHGGELAQDDSLYIRMSRWFFEHAVELKKVLADVRPVAECNQPEVLLFERFSGDARFVWLVNNTMMLEQNPGQAWRTSLIMSQRAPVAALIDFKSGGEYVYDVFGHNRIRAGKKMTPPPEGEAAPIPNGSNLVGPFAEPIDTSKPILADLRSSPVRLYAILPVKPQRMTITVPNANAFVGQELEWKVQSFDTDGKEINANLPIRVTATGQNKQVLKQIFTTTLGRAGGNGQLVTPSPQFGSQVSVGLSPLLTAAERADLDRVDPKLNRVGATAPEHRFGPHFKEIAISADGTTGIINGFNWHENLWAFDVATGATRWKQRIGDHFTYSPQVAGEGFVIQGFDKNTAEGYHLYLLNAKGESLRRFALFGLPKRATSWANGSHLLDRGINSFAAPPDGSWVAAAGDLGLAIWSRDGELLWNVVNHPPTGLAPVAHGPLRYSDRQKRIGKESGKSESVVQNPDSTGTSPVGEQHGNGTSPAEDSRARRRLFVLDGSTLLTATGRDVTAYNASDGKQLWTLNVAPTGSITGGQLSADGKTLVLKTDTDGGRVLVVRDQKIVGTIFQPADVALPTPDGRFVAVTHERQLKWFAADGQLVWQFTGDEFLRNPEISHDGQKIAVCSELGTLTTLSASGEVLGENDLRSLAALKFLKEGDLLAATWTGNLMRFQGGTNGVWMHHFVPFPIRIRSGNEPKKPGERDIKLQFGLLPDNRIWMGWPLTKVVPTTRMAGWGNTAKEPAPLEPNLLSDTKAIIQAVCDPTTHGDPREWKQPIEMLTDGKPDAPPRPWLEWSDINYIDSGWRQKLTLVDTFREQLKVTGVTIAEDPEHPESWFRDVRLQWWDATSESWRDGPFLMWDADVKANSEDVMTNSEFTPSPEELAGVDQPRVVIEPVLPADVEDKKDDNASEKRATPKPARAATPRIHTHWFDQPIEAAKFRFITTGGGTWPSGNLRLGELVFHGERLGCSHPDAVAKKPLAVLFDEDESDLRSSFKHGHNPQFDFLYEGAFFGGRCLSLKQASTANAGWRPQFGHAIPNWNFQIAEKPQPGQYRWLQFAWKATSPQTTGIGLLIGRTYPSGGYAVTCGDLTIREGALAMKRINGDVPRDWQIIKVDLWELFHKNSIDIQSLTLQSNGGGAAFDQIVLAQEEQHLPPRPDEAK